MCSLRWLNLSAISFVNARWPALELPAPGVEALAWFDHWLKGQETGILEGPRFRYVLPGAEGWRATVT